MLPRGQHDVVATRGSEEALPCLTRGDDQVLPRRQNGNFPVLSS